jgi:hypothetical protein
MDTSLHYLHGKCQFLREMVEILNIEEVEEVLDEEDVVDLEEECHEMILGRDK